MMSNEITMNKNTAYLLFGLLLAVVVGGYLMFGSGLSQQVSTCTSPGGCAVTSAQPNSATTSGQTSAPSAQPGQPPSQGGAVQEVYLKALSNGDYDKDQITVKKGIPVRLHFSTQGNVGCGRQLIIRGLGVQAVSNGAEQVVEFTPQNEGTYQYSCSMGMWGPGRMNVVS